MHATKEYFTRLKFTVDVALPAILAVFVVAHARGMKSSFFQADTAVTRLCWFCAALGIVLLGVLQKETPILTVEVYHFFSVPIKMLVQVETDVVNIEVDSFPDHLDLAENVAIEFLVPEEVVLELYVGGFPGEGALAVVTSVGVGVSEVQIDVVQLGELAYLAV